MASGQPDGGFWNTPYGDEGQYGEPDRGDYPRDDYDTRGHRSLVPRLTLPSVPLVSRGKPVAPRREDSGHHRTLLDATNRQQAVRAPSSPNQRFDDDAAAPSQGYMRRRENSSARPLNRVFAPQDDDYAEEARDPEAWGRDVYEDRDDRALVPVASYQRDLVPNLAAFRPRAAARIRADTRALARRAASSPWSLTRLILAIAAITAAILTALITSGEASEPLMGAFGTSSGSQSGKTITSMVQAETQIERPDLYDSYSQFLGWKGAACSAAALSEVLTAWGVQHATIGKVIDALNSGSQPNISPNLGLLTSNGFQYAASQFGYHAYLHTYSLPSEENLSYQQLLSITNTDGIPVIVNVRISWGYYSFFDGGHFLVVTGGDAQGLQIVDSSTYYIHYLQKDVFYSMYTGVTAFIVPNGSGDPAA
jgi:hypothetical protein